MDAVVDDYGNVQHWTTTVRAWHSLGLYGWADGYCMNVLMQSVQIV